MFLTPEQHVLDRLYRSLLVALEPMEGISDEELRKKIRELRRFLNSLEERTYENFEG